MNTQMIICILLFIAMLISFLIAKLPLGVTAGTVAALLVLTNCTEPDTILKGIGSANAVTIACMIILAVGLGRTSFPAKLTSGIRKITGGNYKLAYLGVLLIALALTSMLTSPMAAYAIAFPIMDSVCDEFGVSRSKAQFPLLVVCLACCAILPLGGSISQAAVYDGYMQTYGFIQGFTALDFFQGRWPFIFIVLVWAYFIAPKITLEKPVAPIAALEAKKTASKPLGSFADIAGVCIFTLVILGFIFNKQMGMPTWYIAFFGVMAMIICGTLTKNEAIKAIPVDICMLFIGANTMATALVATGTAEYIGSIISQAVGNATNTIVLHAVFFVVPFLITQFMQNQSVMNVFAPIALITCSAIGADPRGCLVLISAGSLTAYMTPSATAAVPMCMSAGGYDVKALFKMGWLFAVILCVGYVGFVSLAMPAF
ncbi:MAG: anion permease [Enterocloster asparagiformis]|nr:anion permease [Enterocloster asparagiformis]